VAGPIDVFDLDPVWIRDVVEGSGESFARLVAVMAKLRSPTGCPWDLEQTHDTLARHLLEETYEVLEAIDSGDPAALREELGDLVLQALFHSQLAYEGGAFTVSDVLDDLRAKLLRRHPHVFGELDVSGADEVLVNWEKLKRAEKGTGVMDGVPKAMPALARAAKVTRRAAQVGFAWPDEAAHLGDVAEELGELRAELEADETDPARVEAEVGDVLFAVASLARRLGVEPETALRRAVDTFSERFARMESSVSADGLELESLSSAQWAEYWERVKAEP
jgi:MazG family protein